MHCWRSATDVEPGQAKMLAISPAVSAGPHFAVRRPSILVTSFDWLRPVFGSLGATSEPPENEPRQIGARSPAVPSLICPARHLIAFLCALSRNIVPSLESIFTHVRRDAASVESGHGSVVAPWTSALTSS